MSLLYSLKISLSFNKLSTISYVNSARVQIPLYFEIDVIRCISLCFVASVSFVKTPKIDQF